MATRVDCSTNSNVPYCTTCGWRGGTTATRERAFQAAAQHRATAHPDDRASAQNLRRRLARERAGV
jgi:hypothetical protein